VVSRWRARWARRLDPTVAAVPARPLELPAGPAALPPAPPAPPPNVWPGLTHQFALRLLNLVENLRPELDRLEADEDDSTRLARLYRVDHGLTRLRRTAGYLGVLAGVDAGELTGIRSSLVDVIREAESAIEHYTRVAIGRVVELGVVEYASRDVAWLLAALIENATVFSPGAVTVSAWLLADGGVLMRVEDSGIGIHPEQVAAINAWLDGPVLDVDTDTGRHTGLAVAHRLARRHGIGLRLATREPSGTGGTGTVAMIALPPALLCELPTGAAATGQPGPGTAPAWPGGPGGAARGTAAVRPGEAPRLAVPNGGTHAQPAPPAWDPRAHDESTDSIPVPTTGIPATGSGRTATWSEAGPAGMVGMGPELEWPPTTSTSRLRPGGADGGDRAGLPQRQRHSLRGGAEPWRTGPVDPGARQSFAADLGAFTAGERDARQHSAPPAGGSRDGRGGRDGQPNRSGQPNSNGQPNRNGQANWDEQANWNARPIRNDPGPRNDLGDGNDRGGMS
jgi:hypothetical protein